MNWLSLQPSRDPFGKQLLKAGVSQKQIRDWALDPQVEYGPVPIKKSLYDSLEDTDSDYCLALCQMIGCGVKKTDKKLDDLVAENNALKAELAKYSQLADAVRVFQGFKGLNGGGKGGGGGKTEGKGKGKGGKKEQAEPKKKAKAPKKKAKPPRKKSDE